MRACGEIWRRKVQYVWFRTEYHVSGSTEGRTAGLLVDDSHDINGGDDGFREMESCLGYCMVILGAVKHPCLLG